MIIKHNKEAKKIKKEIKVAELVKVCENAITE